MDLLNNNSNNNKQKSLKQRFLFVIGILFFAVYLILGLMVIFWKSIPLNLTHGGRIAFGGLLIVYALIRFYRIVKK